ncbi:MAG: hypothetical protein M0C28_15495 [Candidatus Moduliflexus flocculans]|nr:hypothetical protein [Candidatus Moduliflexus flocculans]
MTLAMTLIFLAIVYAHTLRIEIAAARRRRLHLPRARPDHRRRRPLLLLLDAHPELALRPGLLSHRAPVLGPRAHHPEDAAGRGADAGPGPLRLPAGPRELQLQDGGRARPAHPGGDLSLVGPLRRLLHGLHPRTGRARLPAPGFYLSIH